MGKVKKIFPIVCIGASAGGLEAITELLKNLPADTGMAFIYIQHLSPDHESILISILSRLTKMPVKEAKNLMLIEPNYFYIIPRDKEMRMVDGKLGLTPRKKGKVISMPIDIFFKSLAEKHGDRVIGIILSGAATDGTQGMKSIKLNGGLTFVQDGSAKFSSMPKSAIAENVADFILSPKRIAKELVRLSSNKYLSEDFTKQKEEDIIKDDADLKKLLSLLHQKVGVDFMHYKSTTIKRRVLRRMLLYKITKLKEYLKLLQNKPAEINTLLQDLLINVTSFFRYAQSFDYLKKTIFPKLLKGKSAINPVRIWVCACATGEEAYSLAMSLAEYLGENHSNISVQIFATDLSEHAITKARHGEYAANELHNLTPARIQRFFSKSDGSFRINKNIRDMCIFAPHNVFADPPYSRIDLISCCNLLIYLDSFLQKKILSIFHYALNETGYLMLGRSETISSISLFGQINKKHRIYLKKKTTSQRIMIDKKLTISTQPNRSKTTKAGPIATSTFDDLDKVFDGFLLSHYAPASVIINKALEILQFRGATSLYLQSPQGKASLNVLKMIHPDIAFELHTIIHKAIRSKQSVKRSGIEMKKENMIHFITVEVMPLKGHFDEPLFAIIFREDVTEHTIDKKGVGKNAQLFKDNRIKKLEEQLAISKSDMQTIFEGQETVNEELQSANEEIVSTNEELQSINEELETSKEEIESTNEELLTTNQELQNRNEQLSESYAYNEAVLSTIHEPFIILDKNIRVKSANRAFYKKFHTSERFIEGMYLFDISNKQWETPQLRELLLDIIPTNSHLHNFEVTNDFAGLGKKKFSLNAHRINQKNAREQLIFLAFEDVTENEMRIQKQTDLFFEKIADSAPVMLWVTSADGLVTFLNRTWIEFTGQNNSGDRKRTHGIHPEDISLFLSTYNSALQSKKEYALEFRLRNRNGEYYWVSEKAVPKFSASGDFEGFIGSCIDINDLKEHEQRKDDFIRMASHELKTPITSIKGYVQLLLNMNENENQENSFIKNSLTTVDKQIAKLTKLISDLLDMTKIETAAFNLNKEFFEIGTHVKEIVEETKQLFLTHSIILQQNCECTVYADKDRISQVIINLLTNAVKYSPGKKQVIVEIKCENNEVIVSVQDFGIGITKKDQPKIFERFYRSHEKEEQTFPGFGIGLFIVSEIIKLHEGKIWVHSEKNKGSTFYFSIPLKNN